MSHGQLQLNINYARHTPCWLDFAQQIRFRRVEKISFSIDQLIALFGVDMRTSERLLTQNIDLFLKTCISLVRIKPQHTYFTRNDRFCFPNIVLIHVKHFNPIDTCLIWMAIQQKKGNSPKILLTKAFDWINIRNNHCDWTYLKLFQIINIFKWWQSRFWPSKKTKKWFVLKIVWLTERLLELNLHSWNLKTWKYFRAAQ